VDGHLAEHAARALCRTRASKRWSALLTAKNSRIAVSGIRERLGACLWHAFVEYAHRHYRARWDAAFFPESKRLECCGPCTGSACPHRFEIDLRRESAVTLLERLHLDHEYDVYVVCAAWLCAMPERLQRWDDGIDKGLLCQLLFGVHERGGMRSCVRFRCGNGSEASRGGRTKRRWRHTAMLHRHTWLRPADLMGAHLLASNLSDAT